MPHNPLLLSVAANKGAESFLLELSFYGYPKHASMAILSTLRILLPEYQI